MGIKHNYQSGTANSGTAEVSSIRWNEDHVITGVLPIPAVLAATPAAGYLNLRGYNKAEKVMLGIIEPSGTECALQPHFGSTKINSYQAIGGVTTVGTVLGMAAPTVLGTANARALAATNLATRLHRIGYVSAATAGGTCGMRDANLKWAKGNGVGVGGFFARFRFIPSDAAVVANALMFIGMYGTSTAIAATTTPQSLVNCVGIAQIAGSTNMHIVYGGAVAQTPIDLGANFPCSGAGTAMFELILNAAPDGYIYYYVKNLSIGIITSGTLSAANTPANSTFLCWHVHRSNNATALAVGIDVGSIYIEMDN